MIQLSLVGARQRVAKNHGFSSWDSVPIGAAEALNAEAALLMAHSWANHAAYQTTLAIISLKESFESKNGEAEHIWPGHIIQKIKLPFPEVK